MRGRLEGLWCRKYERCLGWFFFFFFGNHQIYKRIGIGRVKRISSALSKRSTENGRGSAPLIYIGIINNTHTSRISMRK